MKNQIPWNLLGKYFSDEITKVQQNKLMKWVQESKLHEKIFLELQQVWKDTHEQEQEWNVEVAWERVNYLTTDTATVNFNKKRSYSTKIIGSSRRHHLKKYILAIAAMFLMVVFVGWYNFSTDSQPVPEYREIVTHQDQQSRIQLSDGSTITVNEQSILRIPVNFSTSNRKVYLDGEAFFDIKHDANHSFNVYSRGAVIHDLGTRFNLRTDAQNIQVAVIEGKVGLYSKKMGKNSEEIINPYYVGELNRRTNKVSVNKEDVRNYMSWLTNRLMFDNVPLSKISKHLEHIYGIEVQFASEKLKQERITADFKKTSLKDALDIISNALGIGYSINGKTIVWKE